MRVPRTEEEVQRLLDSRPDAWEFLLFAAALLRRQNELEPRYQAHSAYERTLSENELSLREAWDRQAVALKDTSAIYEELVGALKPTVMEAAVGSPGEDGDPDAIRQLAARVIGGYEQLIDWSDGMRGQRVPELFRDIFDRESDLVDLPLEQFRRFVSKLVESLDSLPEAVRTGRASEPLVLKLTVTIDDLALQRYNEALKTAIPFTLFVGQRFKPAFRDYWGSADPAKRDQVLQLLPEFEEIGSGASDEDKALARSLASPGEGNYSVTITGMEESLEAWPPDIALISYLTSSTPHEAAMTLKSVRHVRPERVLDGLSLDDAVGCKEMLESHLFKVKIEEGASPGTYKRHAIPESVRHEVWRRDGGACVDCGSRERLEFDHIVPVSKGGANTARNIELRCEPCNRKKAATI